MGVAIVWHYCHTGAMTNVSTFLVSALLALAAQAVHAQTPTDMSRYESIYSEPVPASPVKAPKPTGVVPGAKVETIAPTGGIQTYGSASNQRQVGPKVSFSADSAVTGKAPISGAVTSNAETPNPKERTTEMITEDAEGNVIERTVITR